MLNMNFVYNVTQQFFGTKMLVYEPKWMDYNRCSQWRSKGFNKFGPLKILDWFYHCDYVNRKVIS